MQRSMTALERPLLRVSSAAASFPPATVIGIYRTRNAGLMASLLEPAVTRGWTVGLWGLDGVAPELAEHTLGSGPGARTDLLNVLAARVSPPPSHYLIVTDDDLRFTVGNLGDLVAMCKRADLWLAQPAHDRVSHASHRITRARFLSNVRTTRFVEIGPVVVFSPGARPELLPFPDGFGMGWGLAVRWWHRSAGRRMGIVDAVRVRHLSKVAAGYATEGEELRLRQCLTEAGLRSIKELHVTEATWRLWDREPPWRKAGDGTAARVGDT